jgi:hypothetical protein
MFIVSLNLFDTLTWRFGADAAEPSALRSSGDNKLRPADRVDCAHQVTAMKKLRIVRLRFGTS